MRSLRVGIIVLSIIAITLWAASPQKAQTVTPNPITIQSTLSHTNCAAVVAGVTQYCFASDGLWVSLSGGVFTQLGIQAPSGVASFTVCNSAGASCGVPQTGAVTINLPTKVTVAAPTATLQ